MTVKKEINGSEMTVYVEGRVDTMTAPELENEVKSSIEGITNLVFDFSEVAYISSAGLRVLLSTQKTMNTQGTMEVRNVNDTLMEIFEVTGFVDILTIK